MLLCVSGFFSSLTHLGIKLSMKYVFGKDQDKYSSINFIIMALLLGLRQKSSNPDQLDFSNQFDSKIPFISGNIVVPYTFLPQLYVCASLLICFVFERPFDLRILIDFFWIWLYLRFFMRTTRVDVTQTGDLSPEFALSSFFP